MCNPNFRIATDFFPSINSSTFKFLKKYSRDIALGPFAGLIFKLVKSKNTYFIDAKLADKI